VETDHTSTPPANARDGDRDCETVCVRRHWNDWRVATYRLDGLSGIHWDTLSGGAKRRAPQPFIHAYVMCDAMLAGEIAHSGLHGSCPHEIKVCVVAQDNSAQMMRALRSLAGPKPSFV
jgi:hypothetical protein